MATFTALDAIIPAGEALSNAVDCATGATLGALVAIICPPDWTSAGGLTFQVSLDNASWHDLYDRDGREVIAAVTPNAIVVVSEERSRAAKWLRLRSGTRDQPFPQPQARPFQIVMAV